MQITKTFVSLCFWLALLATCSSSSGQQQQQHEKKEEIEQQQPPTCSWEDRDNCSDGVAGGVGGTYRDKHLTPIKINLEEHGIVEETFYAYIQPDIAYAYNTTPGSVTAKETYFKGMFGKFINMSNKPVQVYWQPANRKQNPSYIADLAPFGAAGTATFPNHVFLVTDRKKSNAILTEFKMTPGNSLYKYDPYGSIDAAAQVLKPDELELYKLQHRSLAFNRVYQHASGGRQYLGLYGRKHAPRYPIWPADYFGQTFTVETNETHFTSLPPDKVAKKAVSNYGATPEEREQLQQYRKSNNDNNEESGEDATLTLNMTVLSVAPRAFEIRNFLSEDEVHHMLELATGMTLSRSTTKAGSSGHANSNDSTRTSKNSWIGRTKSPIVDAIFRRAADLLQIDEACLRDRKPEEADLVPGSEDSIAERLQLVHYDVGQQYTPHHDFSVPDLEDGQPSRFATLLLYLNEVPLGGETSFPRWLNAETTDLLKVTPEPGKAVLFYNQLPDGNYDERSEHAALPVKEGEKWLANLWVWDPYLY